MAWCTPLNRESTSKMKEKNQQNPFIMKSVTEISSIIEFIKLQLTRDIELFHL